MEVHIKITGILLVLLTGLRTIFPRYFRWDKELRNLSLINRQMMAVHTFFIALMLLMMGLLCLTSATELMETTLGKRLSLGLGIFWLIRLFIQFFGYSPRIWRGKLFETSVHIFFSMLWTYFSYIFLANYYY